MDAKETGRKCRITLRFTSDEYTALVGRWQKTTISKLSEFVRRILFNKELTVKTRNASLDEFMAELLLLKKELNAIGVNFNQATHRLHTLDHLPQMQHWLMGWERDKERLFRLIEAIKLQLGKVEEEWLQ